MTACTAMTMLTDEERDDLYRRCAAAITEAGRSRESLFLARLALLLMERSGDASGCREAIEEALRALPEPRMSA
jgi:hypothetical protein